VQTGTFPVKRVYPAIASSVWKVELVARVQGFLEVRNFKQGAVVQENELLFVIEQDQYEASVASAAAAVAKAIAQAELAMIVIERNAPLVETGAVSAETFNQYEANLTSAQADVMTAEANLVQANLNLGYTEIRSPIAGRVGATSIDPGTFVMPGTDNATLCTVVSMNPIRVNFAPSANEFPEYLAKRVAGEPTHAQVTIPRQATWTREGDVTFIDNTANPNTSLIRMWTDVPNDGYSLLPGQYCEATITMKVLENAITIPSEALVQVASDLYVWLVGSDDKVTQTKVVVELQQNGTAVIKSGLKEGERIVVKGVDKLRINGTKISEAPPAAPPGTPPPAAKTASATTDSKSN
jgi:RND family efflux transporter MFP subunit